MWGKKEHDQIFSFLPTAKHSHFATRVDEKLSRFAIGKHSENLIFKY